MSNIDGMAAVSFTDDLDSTRDLSRNVYGVLGIPIDVDDMADVLDRVDAALRAASALFISTANLNFLATSLTNKEFRKSLLFSDLCTADGMPIVWIAKLLSIPITARITGADIFEALKARPVDSPLKVFFFGGMEGAAAAACHRLNANPGGMTCVGSLDPGFGTVEDMSSDAVIETINASNADVLAVALGAIKGQAWLLHNRDQLRVPIRAHLGATINFQAGTIKRAPHWVQHLGFEWLWRIKEEPKLWKRYFDDGMVLLRLVLTRLLPLLVCTQWNRFRGGERNQGLSIRRSEDHKTVTIRLAGSATARNVGKAVPYFHDAIATGKNVVINCANTSLVDSRFLGLLLMLNKQLTSRRLQLRLADLPPSLERMFRLNEFGYLLNAHEAQ